MIITESFGSCCSSSGHRKAQMDGQSELDYPHRLAGEGTLRVFLMFSGSDSWDQQSFPLLPVSARDGLNRFASARAWARATANRCESEMCQ